MHKVHGYIRPLDHSKQYNFTNSFSLHSTTFALRSQGQAGCQMKQNPSRKLNFKVPCAVFQPILRNFLKCPKYRRKYVKKCQIFEDFLIVTKKQHITLNFDSNNNLVPFDTLVDPDAEKVRNEKLWRAFKPVCTVPSGKKLNPS